MQTSTNIRALIIDMDGVLWHGHNAIPGLVEFFQALEELKIAFILATNDASSTPDQYVKKLAEMGVTVNKNQILTSGIATALYLSEKVNPANTRVFVVGEEGAKQPLIDQGFTLTALYEVNKDSDIVKKGADFVVCGKDHTLTWDKLATATINIRAGAQFIGTNGDTTLQPNWVSRMEMEQFLLPSKLPLASSQLLLVNQSLLCINKLLPYLMLNQLQQLLLVIV